MVGAAVTVPFTLGILTRGRPQAAIACAQSALQHGHDVQTLIVVDDDPEAYATIVAHFEGNPRVRVALLPIRHYYVRGMNQLGYWLANVGADFFAVTNDDVTFERDGWDEIARTELLHRFPGGDGILELAGHDLCAHYASRWRFFADEFESLLAEPAYTFYCSDTELRERAREIDCYAAAPELGLLTHHVTNDEVRSEVSYWLPLDRDEYQRRWQPNWRKEAWMS